MAVLERSVLKPCDEYGWDDFVDHAKEWRDLAKKHGFSPGTPYRYNYGMHPWGAIVVEYHWESLTEMEAKWNSFWADPESQALGEQFFKVYESFHRELLFTISELE
jgi:hypothetical protein